MHPFRQARLDAGLTLRDVGERLGVDRRLIGQWETGVREPRPGSLLRLAGALAVDWVAGGAVGTNQVVAGKLLALGVPVEFVLPFPLEAMGARWAPARRDTLRDLISRVGAVEVLRELYDVRGYHERNVRMLDRADLLVAFWSGAPGGTASMVRNAERRGLPAIRMWSGARMFSPRGGHAR